MTVLQYPSGKPVNWTTAKSTDMVMWDRRDSSGRTIRGSLWTIAHLDWTDTQCVKRFGVHLVVIQPCFNTGVPASAGTHDGDGVLDVYIPGIDWWTAQRFFRTCCWAAWFRFPPLFGYHIHMASVGVLERGLWVGIFVPGQLVDYFAKAFGLKDRHTPGSDHSWGPKDRHKTWPYAQYVKNQEANMPFTDWPQADQDALAEAVAKRVVNYTIGPDSAPLKVREALVRAYNTPPLIRDLARAVKATLTRSSQEDDKP